MTSNTSLFLCTSVLRCKKVKLLYVIFDPVVMMKFKADKSTCGL